jgi:N-formylmaleamate deformylase
MYEPQGTSLFVQANGLRHHVLRYGEIGRDLLILPGITSPALTAEFLAMDLAAEGYRVHVPDIRGRGRSDVAPAGSYTLADYAGDVAGLVGELGLRDPIVLGHSMGARIAAAYSVLHGGAHGPLILADPPLSGPDRGPYPTSWDSFKTQLDEARRGTTPEEMRRFYPKWPLRELEIRAQELPTCDETAILETHRGFETEDFFTYWRRVQPPAIVIRGEKSPVVTDDGAADLAKANPAVPVVGVPEAGHMIPWDNYDGFLSALRTFLSDVSRETAASGRTAAPDQAAPEEKEEN